MPRGVGEEPDCFFVDYVSGVCVFDYCIGNHEIRF